MTVFEDLLVVQAHDTELDQLRHRRANLPQRAALAKLDEVRRELDARASESGTARADLEKRRATLENEVNDLTLRLDDLDRRMRSGEVTATRELTAMVDQSNSLKRRRSDLEDTELELMVALEPLEEETDEFQSRRAQSDGERGALEAEVAEAEVAIDAEVASIAEARAVAAAGIPQSLAATYEHLRARLGGIGAARLIGASCGGCHLTLPATELDRIRREPPDALVTCDHCGRILVR